METVVVEHEFVTRLDAPDALAVARGFLEGLGYRAGPPGTSGFAARRGRARPSLWRNMLEWPHAVHVEFDRARVVVVGSCDTWSGVRRPVEALLRAVAVALERRLGVAPGASRPAPPPVDPATGTPADRAPFDEAVAGLAREHRRRRLRRGVFAGALLLIPVLVAVAILLSLP